MTTRSANTLSLASILTISLATAACSPSGAEAGAPAEPARDENSVRWTTAAPLPEERTEVSLTSDGQRLYLAGGFGPPAAQGERASAPRGLLAYDPATDGWSTIGQLPEGVHHAGFVHLGGRLYIVGGFRETSFDPTGAVRIYDLATGQWSEGAPMPTPRGALAVAVYQGRIHTFGGNVAGPEVLHDHDGAAITADNSVGIHEVYDPATDSWSPREPMPTPRNHHAAAASGDRIHVVGGRAEGNFEMTVHEIYSPATDRWESAAPVPTGRSGIAAVERNGAVYVFGGETFGANARTFDDAERFDPGDGSWERLPPMPSPRHGLGAALLDDWIHVVSGGPNPGFTYGTAHERLGPPTPE
jgi:N-acetylneuraminic acid mutarotase